MAKKQKSEDIPVMNPLNRGKYVYWSKTHKGVTKTFGRQDPNSPDLGRYAALQAFMKYKAEIDNQSGPPPKSLPEQFEEAILNLTYLAKCYHQDENFTLELSCQTRITSLQNLLKDNRENSTPLYSHIGLPLTTEDGIAIPAHNGLSQYDVTAIEWKQFKTRINILKAETPPESLLMAYQIKQYIEFLEEDGEVSISRIGQIDKYLHNFLEWLRKKYGYQDIPAKIINNSTFRELKSDLANGKVTKKDKIVPLTQEAVMFIIKEFVRDLHEREVIDELPRALMYKKSKSTKINKNIRDDNGEVIKKNPIVLTNDDLIVIFKKANRKNKLYFLLMLNMSMSAIDISSMKKSKLFDINGEKIYLFQRSKTAHKYPNANILACKLWPQTAMLLEEFMNKDPNREELLLNEGGGPLVKRDKYTRIDCIYQAWLRLKEHTKINKPIKAFRNTASTRIEAGLGDMKRRLFMGRGFISTDHKHYQGHDKRINTHDKAILDDVIDWLYTEYEIEKLKI